MNLALMIHTFAHLSHLWHMSAGPRGWWAWTQSPREALGYGSVGDHLVWSFETR